MTMQKFEWNQNLSDERCAMPGTFAVFALGLEGQMWWPLICDYLDLYDGENSSLQEKFIYALIKKFGFTLRTMPVLFRGIMSMQGMNPDKEFRTLVANEESLDALLIEEYRNPKLIPILESWTWV